MFLLLTSLAALGIGPALVALGRSRRWALDAADAFVVVALAGIALFHVLPESFAVGGLWSVAGAAVGLFGPMLLEHRSVGAGPAAEARLRSGLVLAGLAVHGVIDGVGLAQEGAHSLALGVLLHRIPEGIAAWTLLRPAWGPSRTIVALIGLGLATSCGLVAARSGLALGVGVGAGIVQAIAIGSVLHVILHHAPRATAWKHHHDHPHETATSDGEPSSPEEASHASAHSTSTHPRGRFHLAAALGTAAGVLTVALLPGDAGDGARFARGVFLHTAAASAPWLLAACLAAGFVGDVSLATIAERGRGLVGVVRAALLAPFLPVCSCGVRPLYDRLIVRNVRGPVAIAVLVSAAGLGPATILLTFGLLGPAVAVTRCVGILVIAVLASAGAGRRAGVGDSVFDEPRAASRRLRWSPLAVLETVDYAGAWLIAGLAAVTLASPLAGVFGFGIPQAWVVVLWAVAGMPFYIGAAGATPFAAVLIERGVSPGAAIAFMLTAPTANISTLRRVTRQHGRVSAIWFVASVVMSAVGIGLAFDTLVPTELRGSPPAPIGGTFGSAAALTLLGLLVAVSVVRNGPRHLLSQIVSQVASEY